MSAPDDDHEATRAGDDGEECWVPGSAEDCSNDNSEPNSLGALIDRWPAAMRREVIHAIEVHMLYGMTSDRLRVCGVKIPTVLRKLEAIGRIQYAEDPRGAARDERRHQREIRRRIREARARSARSERRS